MMVPSRVTRKITSGTASRNASFLRSLAISCSVERLSASSIPLMAAPR